MRSKLSRAVGALVLALATSLAGAPAAAGPEQDKAQARQLGIEGVEAFERGDWSSAIARFESAEQLFHAPTHLLFIARAQVELGQLVAARATYLRLEEEKLSAGASPAFKKAQLDGAEERARLEARIPTLVVRADPPGVEGLEVTIDGRAIAAADLAAARVDPGRHRIEGRAGDRTAPTVEVEVVSGERREVVLDFAEDAAGTAAPMSRPSTPADEAGDGASTTTILGVSAIGVGVAGLGVGAVLGILSLGKSGDADALYAQCGGDGGCDPSSADGQEVQSLDEGAATLGTVGVIALGAGAAVAATGVALLLVGGGDAEPADARVELVPAPGGAWLRGRF